MAIDTKLIDQLLAEHGHRPEDIAGETGLLKQLTKAVLERAMQAEMTGHLGYEKHDPAGYKSGNSRNGNSKKKLAGDFGAFLNSASPSLPKDTVAGLVKMHILSLKDVIDAQAGLRGKAVERLL